MKRQNDLWLFGQLARFFSFLAAANPFSFRQLLSFLGETYTSLFELARMGAFKQGLNCVFSFGKKRKGRGQVFSADSLLGVIVFLFVLSIIFFYFNQLFQRNAFFEEDLELQVFSFNALSGLVEAKGMPENWHLLQVSDVNALGIVSESNVLDSGKLSRFLEISGSDYNSVKKALGLQKFDFRFKVNDLNGSLIFSAGSSNPSTISFKASRLALFNGSAVLVSLEAFK